MRQLHLDLRNCGVALLDQLTLDDLDWLHHPCGDVRWHWQLAVDKPLVRRERLRLRNVEDWMRRIQLVCHCIEALEDLEWPEVLEHELGA
jgi:hypothetical protein